MRIIELRPRPSLVEESVAEFMNRTSRMIKDQSREEGSEETRAATACVNILKQRVKSHAGIYGCLKDLRMPIVAEPEISALVARCLLSTSIPEGRRPYIARRDSESENVSIRFYTTNHPKIFLEELTQITSTNGVNYSLVGQSHVRVWGEELTG